MTPAVFYNENCRNKSPPPNSTKNARPNHSVHRCRGGTYEQGALADLDQQNDSNWRAYFADESVWLNLKDLFNDEWDENNFSGARAYVYDDIYNSICRAINDCADEE